MNAATLLASLRSRGVVLAADGDRLRVDAPVGALTPDDRAALAEAKPALLALLAAGAPEASATLGAGPPCLFCGRSSVDRLPTGPWVCGDHAVPRCPACRRHGVWDGSLWLCLACATRWPGRGPVRLGDAFRPAGWRAEEVGDE